MGRYSGLRKSAEELFLETLLDARGRPISQKEMREQTGLNRDTIYEVSAKLQAVGKIRIEKEGRYTKYAITIKGLENLDAYSAMFSFYALEDFLSPVESHLLQKDVDGKMTNQKPLMRAHNLESDLSEFSTRLGALLFYTIIHALRKVKENNELSSYEKDRIAERTIEKIVSSLFPQEMLKCFIRWFSRYDEKERVFFTLKELNDHLREERSAYDYSYDFIDRLSGAFAKNYPSFSKRLQLIENEIENDMKRMKNASKQRSCKHQFKFKTIDGIRSKKCQKCGHKEILSVIKREHGQGDIVSVWYNGLPLP